MTVIGVDIPADRLIIQKGRDFNWSFTNIDTDGSGIDFPSGELYFEFDTGYDENSVQQVYQTMADGGTYRLSLDGEYSLPIDYYDVTNAPENMPGDITDALEHITGLAGNVEVTSISLRPEWVLKITLNAGVNEVQRIYFTGDPDDGDYKLSYGAHVTPTIPFESDAAYIQGVLEDLAPIGAGNVEVTEDGSGGFYVEFIGALAETDVDHINGIARGLTFRLLGGPLGLGVGTDVRVDTVVEGSSKIGEGVVNLLNDGINDFFNMFENLFGCDIQFTLTDTRNITYRCTGRREFKENELRTFLVDVTDTALKSFFNGIATFLGVFDTIHVDFHWNHRYQVEFINDKGNQAVSTLVVDQTDLTGVDDEQSVSVDVLQDGKARIVKWPFEIDGPVASVKIESEEVDMILPGVRWQLVFMPDGEDSGGVLIGRGKTVVQQ